MDLKIIKTARGKNSAFSIYDEEDLRLYALFEFSY
jgi:hypothetical protein